MHSKHWELSWLYIIIVVSLVCYIIYKALDSCLQPLLSRQMISLKIECQKRNKENDQLKECEPDITIFECHTKIQ